MKGLETLFYRVNGSKMPVSGNKEHSWMTNTKAILALLVLLIFPQTAKSDPAKILLPFSHSQDVVVCEFDQPQLQIPEFGHTGCQNKTLAEIDPQGTNLWVQIRFDRPNNWDKLAPPYGFYLFGKVASELYLNGEYLGSNGQPAHDTTEQPGDMDAAFFIPNELMQDSGNTLVAHISSQHNLIHLGYPIHFWGFGQYGDPKRYVQYYSGLGLALGGAFSVGALYFLFLSLGKNAAASYRIFSALCLLAALHIIIEISRGIVSYPYPFQDLRLLLVTGFSFIFGTLILSYSSIKVARRHASHWIYAGVIITLLAMIFAPGFDAKTTAGIFFPLLVSLVQLFYCWFRSRDKKTLRWFLVQLTVALTIVISNAGFHEITYFIIIAVLLVYLFMLQAKDYQMQQDHLQLERTRLAKLGYKLAQNSQSQAPSVLEINVAGKTEFITTTDIAYCKAAGDYVELHLNNLQEKLYSGSLKQLEEMLPPTFLRVHRSYIVNLSEVVSLSANRQENQATSVLCLTGQQQVPVSRRLLPSVKDSLKQAKT